MHQPASTKRRRAIHGGRIIVIENQLCCRAVPRNSWYARLCSFTSYTILRKKEKSKKKNTKSRMFAERLTDFSLPWCQALLNSPHIIDISLPTRRPQGTNPIINTTLRTEATIPAWKSLRTREIEDPTHLSATHFLMLSLGNGLDGYHNTLHGGMSGVLLDQSNVMCANSVSPPPNVTAQLDLRYKKSVPVPGVVLCRSVVVRREGKKMWVRGTIEDGEAGVYCESESLIIGKGRENL